jgi:hypothetical protein
MVSFGSCFQRFPWSLGSIVIDPVVRQCIMVNIRVAGKKWKRKELGTQYPLQRRAHSQWLSFLPLIHLLKFQPPPNRTTGWSPSLQPMASRIYLRANHNNQAHIKFFFFSSIFSFKLYKQTCELEKKRVKFSEVKSRLNDHQEREPGTEFKFIQLYNFCF